MMCFPEILMGLFQIPPEYLQVSMSHKFLQ